MRLGWLPVLVCAALACVSCTRAVTLPPPRPAVDPVPWTPPPDEPGPAAPAPPTDAELAKAREAFGKGTELYQQGEFAAARLQFAEAYQLSRDPTALFQLARCEYALGDIAAACSDYGDYQSLSIERATEASSDPALDKACRTAPPREPQPAPEPIFDD
jgi:hypothetical protein